ncbi:MULTISPECIES: hypothetical protein [Paraburkholderia]|uniref:hypothetical protein n=1 Tax=Paraburkholderia TaxID=1822464 RepID=UPI002259E23E|nr:MULTISPECIES: hypothetical protein [Paraburkholderia]MCX4177695.1 hypothetical protein [Paraburkholderia madseniana]MDQ6465683.1 hypothetical protein [Paraburkholderia madseniana]
MKIEINVTDLVNYLPTVLHALQTNQVGAAYLVALAALLLCGLIVRRPESKKPASKK